jgi:hypothetical protein
MNTRILMTLAMCICAAVPIAAGEEFVRGHVYMSVREGEGCEMGGQEWIYRYDPVTGETSILAALADIGTYKDGVCDTSGLRFTPDGKRLLALNLGIPGQLELAPGSVLSFGASGLGEVFLSGDDGIQHPLGANGLAFDAQGDLYVKSGFGQIVRFPADGGVPTVLADGAGGVFQCTSLDFSPSGDLYCGGRLAPAIVRIAPDGEVSVFDSQPGVRSLAFDRHGDLFALVGATLYQYVDGDPNKRRFITSDFVGETGIPISMTVAAFGDVIYVGELGGLLYMVQVCTKRVTVVANLSGLGFVPRITGMTIHEPLISNDFDGDADVDIQDFAGFLECASQDTGPITPGCLAGDSDGDGDVDFVDFGAFQRRFTGSKRVGCLP